LKNRVKHRDGEKVKYKTQTQIIIKVNLNGPVLQVLIIRLSTALSSNVVLV